MIGTINLHLSIEPSLERRVFSSQLKQIKMKSWAILGAIWLLRVETIIHYKMSQMGNPRRSKLTGQQTRLPRRQP